MPIGGAAMRAGNSCNDSKMKNRVARTGNAIFRFSHFINVQIRFFEEKRDYTKAADYYHQALEMKDHEYQNDIDNDAKAGLKRIGK